MERASARALFFYMDGGCFFTLSIVVNGSDRTGRKKCGKEIRDFKRNSILPVMSESIYEGIRKNMQ